MNTKTNIHFRQLIRTAVLLLFLAGFQQFAWAYDATVTTVNELKTALANASGTAPYEIFIKNGTYDLGTVYNTEVKSYTHLIGESCDGVIIKNSPTTEGLGTTATLKTGSNVSIKNLTLKCRAAWAGSAERGVCLWDAGTGNTYENICLDGLQDTYYSKGSAGMTCTFKDCIIRGTVDFICGSGNITFNNCSLELYIPHSGSTPIIAAPATYTSEKDGYIFNNCTIKAATTSIDCPKSSSTTHSTASVTAGKYYLGRAWYAGSSTDRTPKLTFNDVTYDSDLIPNSALWTKMSDSDVMPATFSVSEKAIEMSYSATAEPYYGTSGQILSFAVKADESYTGTHAIEISDINISSCLGVKVNEITTASIEVKAPSDNPVVATSISLDKLYAVVMEGESATFVATVEPFDVTMKDVEWSTSDTTIATVDQNGNVTGLKKGVALITATTKDGTNLTAQGVVIVDKEDFLEGDIDHNGIIDIADVTELIIKVLSK